MARAILVAEAFSRFTVKSVGVVATLSVHSVGRQLSSLSYPPCCFCLDLASSRPRRVSEACSDLFMKAACAWVFCCSVRAEEETGVREGGDVFLKKIINTTIRISKKDSQYHIIRFILLIITILQCRIAKYHHLPHPIIIIIIEASDPQRLECAPGCGWHDWRAS